MAGALDETSARDTLIAMLGRIAQGPYITLGVEESASAAQVRGAFLGLTKQYHPARFGRMSTELQKLSNEVFLGIKSAHDQLMRATGGARQSGQMPVINAEGSSSHGRPGTPPQRGATSQQPSLARTMTPLRGLGTQPPTTRPTTPTEGRTPTPPARPGTPPQRPTTSQSPPIAERPAPVQRTAPVFDERVALQGALDLMKDGDWRGAREAMQALAAKVPQNKQYRALLCFTRGREAHVAGKFDEAILEYQRALQLHPELVQAQQALVDAQRRR